MSGGHFNYDQHRIRLIADEIERLIETNTLEETDSYGDKIGHFFPKKIIEKFKKALITLRKAEVMTQRIDWLVSGDDGEESFLQRWNEDLSKIEVVGLEDSIDGGDIRDSGRGGNRSTDESVHHKSC